VQWVSRYLGVSRATLFRRFRATYGIPPTRYLLDVRLHRTTVLLRDPRLTMQAVAQACGFSKATRMSAAFRQRYGLTPLEWRRQWHWA